MNILFPDESKLEPQPKSETVLQLQNSHCANRAIRLISLNRAHQADISHGALHDANITQDKTGEASTPRAPLCSVHTPCEAFVSHEASTHNRPRFFYLSAL